MANAQETLDLTRRLAKAARSVKMYGPDHQQSVVDVQGFKTTLERLLGAEPKINFVLQGNAVLVQDLVQPFKDATVAFLVESMRARQITSVTFLPGVEAAEVFRLARWLTAKPEEVHVGAELRPEVYQGLDRVRLNDVRFMAVSAGETVADASAVTGGGTGTSVVQRAQGPEPPTGTGGSKKLSGPVPLPPSGTKKISGAVPLPPGSTAVVVSGPMQELLPLLESLAKQGGVGDTKKKLVDLLSRQAPTAGGLSLGERVRQVMERVPDNMRGQLQTPEMKTELSAAILARQLETGTDVGSLQQTFQEFAPDVGGAMELLDAVTRALQSSGNGASIEALEKAMKFLPMVDKIEELLHGTVLVVEADVERRASYMRALSERGYEVDFAGTVKDGTELGIVKGRYDCIVMDMVFPDGTGHSMLSKLHRAKVNVPVVIASPKAETYMFDFEVLAYPKKKFLQTIDPKTIVEVVKEVATPRMRTHDETEKLDRQRAKEIQAKLVPAKLPPMEGWESAVVYKPAGMVGGDYVDAFPIDDGHTGFVIADVSGKGFTGAMVMVMVRSAFRLATPGILSPRDAVMRVNRLVTPDLQKGMFVTLCYGCLEQATGRMALATAAHNPPFVYDPVAKKARRLATGGMPVGLTTPEKFEAALVEEQLTLAPGGHILLYTDGVTEAMNAAETQFGEERTAEIIEKAADQAPGALIDALLAAIADHRAAAAPSDDITMLDLRLVALPPPPAEWSPIEE